MPNRLLGKRVLVTGGGLASAELYDPDSGTWTATEEMTEARSGHAATLLPDGTVLVAGGVNGSSGTLASAEIYDLSSGSWAASGNLADARYGHTATLLLIGRALVVGGIGSSYLPLAAAEMYDPGTVVECISRDGVAHAICAVPHVKVGARPGD